MKTLGGKAIAEIVQAEGITRAKFLRTMSAAMKKQATEMFDDAEKREVRT